MEGHRAGVGGGGRRTMALEGAKAEGVAGRGVGEEGVTEGMGN